MRKLIFASSNVSYLIVYLIAGLIFWGCASKPTPVVKTLNEVSYGKDPVRAQASPSIYATSGLCNGLPRVNVKTAPGFCLGLVDSGEGLVKPRYALQVDERHILVTEMGGWKANLGQIYMLTFENKKWVRRSLINTTTTTEAQKCILDRTQQLVRGPDNKIFVTSVRCIAEISPFEKNADSRLKILINNLPTEGLHASKAIAFDPAGNMYMNIGSVTDNCELETTDTCKETQGLLGRGLVRKYLRLSDGSYDMNYSIFSRGQRNSTALYWDEKSNSLWTGENARDYIERKDSRLNGQEQPSDEMNIVKENAELDWPYCYDDGVISPEFPNARCDQYQQPHLLFPAHSSPLGFLMYTGTLFPKWYQNRLLITFHGYASYGHRIVAYKRNENLEPVGEPLSIVYGWEAKGNQLVGSPVGITQGLDGSVFIVEDNSQKVLQLFYDKTKGDGQPVAELKVGSAKVDDSQIAAGFKRAEDKRKEIFQAKLKKAEVPLFTQIQNKVIDQNCTMCHGGTNYPGMQILKYDDVGNYKKLKEQFWPRISGQGAPQMPPSGLPEDQKKELIDLVKRWVDAGYPAP